MKITDVVAYPVECRAEYNFTRPPDPGTRESDTGPVGQGEALAAHWRAIE